MQTRTFAFSLLGKVGGRAVAVADEPHNAHVRVWPNGAVVVVNVLHSGRSGTARG